MKIEEKYNFIFDFEKKNNAYEYFFKGIPVWIILRQSIILSIEKNYNNTPVINSSSLLKKINLKTYLFLKFFVLNFFEIILSFLKFLKLIFGIKKVQFLFLSANNFKRDIKNEKHYDIFCDPIIEEISFQTNVNNHIVLETSNDYSLKQPSFHNSINIQLILHISHFLSFFFALFSSIFPKSELNHLLKNVNNCFSNIDGLDFKKISYYSFIFQVFNIYILSFLFKMILKFSDIKKVFMICFYGPQGIAMCKACSDENIHSIDIQHGVQGKYHYAYSNWENLTKQSSNVFPKEFWVWSSIEEENINKWANQFEIVVKNSGNLYYEGYTKKISSQLLDLKSKFLSEGKRIVLYTLDNFPFVPKNILDIIDDSSVLWLFRFHPRTLEHEKKKIKNKLGHLINVEFYYANSCNLYEILQITNCHVTEMSTVVIESTFFNVPSIIISELGKDYYSEYIISKKAHYIQKSNEILALIKNSDFIQNKQKTFKKEFKISKEFFN